MGQLKLNGKLLSYEDDTTVIYDEYDAKKIQDDIKLVCDYFKQMVSQLTRKSTPTVNNKHSYQRQYDRKVDLPWTYYRGHYFYGPR